MMSLLALVINAPLVGVRKRWPTTLHAVDMDGLPIATWPKGTATSTCGLTGLRLFGNADGDAVPWPPRLSTLPDGMSRCADCYQAAGVKKVRSEFQTRPSEETA